MDPAERETTIQFDDGDPLATVWTHHRRWQNHLRRVGATPVADNGHGGLCFRIPWAWVRLPRPRRQGRPQPRAGGVATPKPAG